MLSNGKEILQEKDITIVIPTKSVRKFLGVTT